MEEKITTMTEDMHLKTRNVDFYKCAVCKTVSVAKQYGRFNYCPYCGYKIDWRNDYTEVE